MSSAFGGMERGDRGDFSIDFGHLWDEYLAEYYMRGSRADSSWVEAGSLLLCLIVLVGFRLGSRRIQIVFWM